MKSEIVVEKGKKIISKNDKMQNDNICTFITNLEFNVLILRAKQWDSFGNFQMLWISAIKYLVRRRVQRKSGYSEIHETFFK